MLYIYIYIFKLSLILISLFTNILLYLKVKPKFVLEFSLFAK